MIISKKLLKLLSKIKFRMKKSVKITVNKDFNKFNKKIITNSIKLANNIRKMIYTKKNLLSQNLLIQEGNIWIKI